MFYYVKYLNFFLLKYSDINNNYMTIVCFSIKSISTHGIAKAVVQNLEGETH